MIDWLIVVLCTAHPIWGDMPPSSFFSFWVLTSTWAITSKSFFKNIPSTTLHDRGISEHNSSDMMVQTISIKTKGTSTHVHDRRTQGWSFKTAERSNVYISNNDLQPPRIGRNETDVDMLKNKWTNICKISHLILYAYLLVLMQPKRYQESHGTWHLMSYPTLYWKDTYSVVVAQCTDWCSVWHVSRTNNWESRTSTLRVKTIYLIKTIKLRILLRRGKQYTVRLTAWNNSRTCTALIGIHAYTMYM